MTDSTDADSSARRGKRERLIDSACELLYSQGIARTTLAEISEAANVPLGNVYYYFKTKDAIVEAVVEARTEQLRGATAALQRKHGTPKTRLKALVGMLAEERDMIADHGCPFGTLCTDLSKQSGEANPLTAPLIQTLLDWAEQQFRALGLHDASDLAVELLVAYQGSAVLTNALGDPEVMTREARRIEKWISAL
ncbi:MAG: TetR/AcrR family transcriptional regulator [Mycobacterium sp.]